MPTTLRYLYPDQIVLSTADHLLYYQALYAAQSGIASNQFFYYYQYFMFVLPDLPAAADAGPVGTHQNDAPGQWRPWRAGSGGRT